jgi:hypothetical protein
MLSHSGFTRVVETVGLEVEGLGVAVREASWPARARGSSLGENG